MQQIFTCFIDALHCTALYIYNYIYTHTYCIALHCIALHCIALHRYVAKGSDASSVGRKSDTSSVNWCSPWSANRSADFVALRASFISNSMSTTHQFRLLFFKHSMNQHFLKLLLSDICGTGVLMPWMWERTWLLKQLQRRRAERARERERERSNGQMPKQHHATTYFQFIVELRWVECGRLNPCIASHISWRLFTSLYISSCLFIACRAIPPLTRLSP